MNKIFKFCKFIYKKLTLNIMILMSMIIGVIVGLLMGKDAVIFQPLGDLFMRLISMLVAPLIIFSIITGAAHIRDMNSPGKIGGFMISYFFGTAFIAIVLAIILAIIFKPGVSNIPIPKDLLTGDMSMFNSDMSKIQGFWGNVLNIIPINFITSLSSQNIIQILFFVIFFGIGLSYLPKEKKQIIMPFFDSCNDIIMWMMKKVMYYSPIGIFGLVAASIGGFGYHLLLLLMNLIILCFIANVIFTYGILLIFIKFLSKIPPIRFLKETLQVQIISFTTASSIVSLPMKMEACKKMGVSKSIYSLILTIGSTANMNGNGLFYAMSAIFVAQLFGIHLDVSQYIAIILTCLVGASGSAGVPGPSILLIVVLIAANLPVAAIPIIFAVDRIFDMMRTTVNCMSNVSCAVIAQNISDKIDNKRQTII